jgi:tRNA wybutosine-synthesizing protein 1
MDAKKLLGLEEQGYRMAGRHSAIKICHWTRECIRGKDSCYKNTFYGINSHRCVQMTPVLDVCTHRCKWCWRDIDKSNKRWKGKPDSPSKVIAECIKQQKQILYGFGGNKKADRQKYEEALEPKHFAISLTGEPTLYPKLPELIKELTKRGITSFLVTNGTQPEMIKKLIKNPPTQIYLTLPAPNKKIYMKVCRPLIKDGWERIMKTLRMIKKFPRSTIRLTLVKGENMINPEEYAKLIKNKSDFIELKAYMWVGHSMKRLKYSNMPVHAEIKEFAEQIAGKEYRIAKEKENSRVVLLQKKGSRKKLHYSAS